MTWDGSRRGGRALHKQFRGKVYTKEYAYHGVNPIEAEADSPAEGDSIMHSEQVRP